MMNSPRREGRSIGDAGAILSGVWGGSPRIIPEARMRERPPPPPTLPRSRGHHRDWIDACKGGPPASAHSPTPRALTEIVLLVRLLADRNTLHSEWTEDEGDQRRRGRAVHPRPFPEGMGDRLKRILLAALLPGLAVLSLPRGTACSTLLAGRLASTDGLDTVTIR